MVNGKEQRSDARDQTSRVRRQTSENRYPTSDICLLLTAHPTAYIFLSFSADFSGGGVIPPSNSWRMNLIISSTCCEESFVLNDGIPSPPSRMCFRKSESGCRAAWPSRRLGTFKRVPSSSFTGPPLPSTP